MRSIEGRLGELIRPKKRSKWSVRGDKIKQRIISSSKTRSEPAPAREASREREERPSQDASEAANESE
ncbi:hypothetical protein MRB53_040627 [Persea americana]|nr:hypothetical protein MRB53_040627 [Persea americana]